ncbi:MAG: hypothetical protein HOQ43_10750 [Glycomyces artemisiae]|uniref:Uncharacterized protein n=1 Tax=Glycomyces artemisiae TaxID=1076443 RepID=A0A850C6N6_9ACTN|nr:hypothetical protein [Glycomyces artemisiae]
MQINPKTQMFADGLVALSRAWEESHRQLAAAFEIALAKYPPAVEPHERTEREQAAADTAMLRSPEYRDTAAIVHRVVDNFVQDSPHPDGSIDLDDMAVREYLTYAIAKALVGDESEQSAPPFLADEEITERRLRVVLGMLEVNEVSAPRVSLVGLAEAVIKRLDRLDSELATPWTPWKHRAETVAEIANAFNAEVFADADRCRVIADALGPVIDSTMAQTRTEYLDQMVTAVHNALVAHGAYREAPKTPLTEVTEDELARARRESENTSPQWVAECEAVARVLRDNEVTAPAGITDDILIAVAQARSTR